MSLQSRLQASVACRRINAKQTSATPIATVASSSPAPLLPYSLVAPILEQNKMLQYNKLSPQQVHLAMLDVHRRLYLDMTSLSKGTNSKKRNCTSVDSEVDAELHANMDVYMTMLHDAGYGQTDSVRPRTEKATLEPSSPHVGKCINKACDSNQFFVDYKEGHEVCAECGVVQQSQSMNFHESYDAGKYDKLDEETTERCVKGVSRRVMDMVQNGGSRSEDDFNHSNYWNDIQHWRMYERITDATAHQVDNILREWKGGGHSRITRLIATMLYVKHKDCFPNERSIRQCVGNQRSLPQLQDPEPIPRFQCQTCLRMLHTAKHARWHCRKTDTR